MRNEFTAVIEQTDNGGFFAYCPEIPGARAAGKAKAETLQSLSDSIAVILKERREASLREVPNDALREEIVVRVGLAPC